MNMFLLGLLLGFGFIAGIYIIYSIFKITKRIFNDYLFNNWGY